MTSAADLQTRISLTVETLKSVEQKQKVLVSSLKSLRSQRVIHCEACFNSHQICTLDLVRTHWYVRPSGCSDGDYWIEGEWQFICPATKVRNRLLFEDSYDARRDRKRSGEENFKSIYGGLFRSVTDEYERKSHVTLVNNFYLDKNRELFDLPPRS